MDVGETGHDDDFLSGEGFFDASGDFDAAGAAFHADIHEDDVGLQNLGGHFCHFGELQDFHDFDFPRFSNRWSRPSSRILWSSTIITRIIGHPLLFIIS